jgi:hypothetical protein
LYEVPRQERNEEYQKHNHEEPQAGYSRRMSRMRDQDVQNREGLKLILRVAESLEGWVSVHKDTQPSITGPYLGLWLCSPTAKIVPELLIGI